MSINEQNEQKFALNHPLTENILHIRLIYILFYFCNLT